MSQRIKLFLLGIGIVLLGFLREYFFINTNWIYLTLTQGRPNSARNEFDFLLDWQPSNIFIAKWFMTLFFFAAFFYLTFVIVKIAFANKTFNRIVVLLFASLLLFSALLYGLEYLFNNRVFYGITRTLMGYGQSFIPLMILSILFKFFPEKSQEL